MREEHRKYREKRHAAGYCDAAHPSGYTCERGHRHQGQHRGGDLEWWGTCRSMETRGHVHRELLDGARTAAEISERTGLSPSTVRAHLRGLQEEGLARQNGPHRVGEPAVWFEA